jgi:raffinose/stachyose/melibiose transport system permease protein
MRRHASPDRSRSLYLFALPALVLYSVFYVWPTLRTLYFSTRNWEGPGFESFYVGPDLFKELRTDAIFRSSVTTTLHFMLIVLVLQVSLSLYFAVRLVRNSKRNIALRALFFLPTILSATTIAFMFLFIYDPAGGVIAKFFEWFPGDYAPSMLGSSDTALYFVAIAQAWHHIGQMIVVWIAGLQAIPHDYYEAAAIDGASPFQRFWKITWPLVAPATAIVVSYTTFQSFRAFELVFNLTEGGPSDATRILSFHIYRTQFQSGDYGLASAQSVVFMVVIVAIIAVQRATLWALGARPSRVS